MSLSCTVSDILSIVFLTIMRSRDLEHIPFRGNLSVTPLYQSAHDICIVPSFTDAKDMIAGGAIVKRVT